jgi:uncharacterized membrane protein
MDWKLIFSTFLVIFLAELGDKTQLASMAASAGSNQPFSVLTGAVLALTLSSAIAVAAGALFGKFIPIRYIKIAAGAVFILFGVLYFKDAFMKEKEAAQEQSEVGVFMGNPLLRTAKTFEEREWRCSSVFGMRYMTA